MPNVKKTNKSSEIKTKKSVTKGDTKKNVSTKSVVVKKIKPEDKIVKPKFTLLRGMHDILPREDKYWKPFRMQAEKLAEQFRFKKIDTPVMEDAKLFIRSIGKGTDVVDKEMYIFEDRDGTKVALRPEMTASVVRAYIMHGFWNMPKPLKLWYWGAMFRHDRPQAGRYRQFNQLGFEIIGKLDPVVDAELIIVGFNMFADLGLPVKVKINSLGTLDEREKYKKTLVEFYRSKRSYLCDDCKKRLNRSPLRLLDCKQEQCQVIKDETPQILEWLDNDSKKHFMKVLEYLDELNIPYELDHTLVRGLDYYTRTVFEFFPAIEEEDNDEGNSKKIPTYALGGGGRYDLLVEQMGGKETAAGGLALGVERMVSYLRYCLDKKICSIDKYKPDIFLAQLGEMARSRALKIINDLRHLDFKVDFNLSKKSLKDQLDIANGSRVPYVLILGQKEVQDNTIIVRDMDSGVQEIVDQKKIVEIITKKLNSLDQSQKK